MVLALAAGLALLATGSPEPTRIAVPATPEPGRRITVEVLNGTRRAGAARAGTRILRRRGIDVVFFGNADAAVHATEIIVRRGVPAHGRDVRAALGVGRIVLQTDTLRRVDVSVVLGPDFRPVGEFYP